MDRRKREVEQEEEREEEKEAAGAVARCRAPLRLFLAGGLARLQALADRREQCEAGLFGDVFSAGLVYVFSAFLVLDFSGVVKEEDRVWPAWTIVQGLALSW